MGRCLRKLRVPATLVTLDTQRTEVPCRLMRNHLWAPYLLENVRLMLRSLRSRALVRVGFQEYCCELHCAARPNATASKRRDGLTSHKFDLDPTRVWQ